MNRKPSEEPREGTDPCAAERATSGQAPTVDGGTEPDVPPKAGMPVYQAEEVKPPARGKS